MAEDVAEPAEPAEPAESAPVEVEPVAEDPAGEEPTAEEAEAEEAAAAAAAAVESAEEARETGAPVSDDAVIIEAPSEEPLDQIEPAAGRIGKLRGRLSRSQNAIGQGLLGILTAGDLDEDAWEEI